MLQTSPYDLLFMAIIVIFILHTEESVFEFLTQGAQTIAKEVHTTKSAKHGWIIFTSFVWPW